MNSGIQDAVRKKTSGPRWATNGPRQFNLSWKLALVVKGLAPPQLLASYNSERVPVIQEMVKRTTAMFEKFAKQAVTSVFNNDSAFLMIGINYRWSNIIVDDRIEPGSIEDQDTTHAYIGKGDGVHGGDRAPQAPALAVTHVAPNWTSPSLQFGDSTTLFDLFRPDKHTALVFMTPAADSAVVGAAMAALQAFPSDTVQTVVIVPSIASQEPMSGALKDADATLVDTEGHAFSGYGCEGNRLTIVLVRPDGYVGAYVRSVDGIVQYREKVFLA
jgi:hypothetical protein